MANIRLQTILKKQVEEIAKEKKCEQSIAFICLILKEVFGLDEFEIEEAITDGGMDKGIDAIFEKEDDGENILYVVQSKFFDKNPDKTIDENSKNLVVEAVSNYILGDYPLNNLNKKLKQKVELYRGRLSKGSIDRVGLLFFTNGQRPGSNIISELDKFKQDQEGQVFYEILTEEDLFSIFLPVSASTVKSVELKVVKDSGVGEKSFLGLPDVDMIQGKVFKVDVAFLARVVEVNPNIFSANVRAYQSLRNKVNEQIASTLRDPDLIKEFIYLNNGITVICDDFQLKPGGEIVEIEKPSIINGCQTGSTILEVYKEGKIEENVGFVLVRLVKTKNESVKEKIIKASNTQTAIKSRDLISEEKIQKELESQFEQLGYYYDRKKGLHRDKPKEKIVDLEKAAQAYLALYLRKPADAKNKKSEIYKSYYEQIFNKDLTANQLLVSWRLLNKVHEKIKELRKTANEEKKSILGNSVLHLLPLFEEWALKPENKTHLDFEDNPDSIDEVFDSKSEKVINRLIAVINKIKNKRADFNSQYFFKSSNSLSEILQNKEGKVEYSLEIHRGNAKRIKDLRYYKPDKYSVDGQKYHSITHWNDLFVRLIELYADKNDIEEGNLSFIDSGSRMLLTNNPSSEEKKLRKKLKSGLWLLTNFSSKYLSRFCFALAKELNLDLKIKLRPTRFREQRKYRKK